MNQNQCVPNWNLHDVTPIVPPIRSLTSRSQSTPLSTGLDTSTVDYEMAELTWQNGQLTMHGLGLPRAPTKTNQGSAWDDKQVTRACGTLESIVNQAGIKHTPTGTCDQDDNLVPWLRHSAKNYTSTPASVPVAMDALVPSDNNGKLGLSKCMVGSSTRVGSCSAAAVRGPVGSDWSLSATESDRWQSMRGGEETSEQLRSLTANGITSTSFGASMENTKTITLDNDHDSVCHSRPHRERDDQEEGNQRRNTTKSTKRSRAAAIHNQSERKRRDKINQRMKTLQKMVPNSNKTDKASMLEEVIDYLKQLQAQVQMFNTMRLPSMMMPLAIQQQLQMPMMTPLGMGMGMGMGMNMDPMNMTINNAMARPNITAIPPTVINPAAYMSFPGCDNTSIAGDRMSAQPNLVSADPLSAYLACQSNPNTMEAYSRIAAMYQQLQQQQQPSQHQQPGPSPNS